MFEQLSRRAARAAEARAAARRKALAARLREAAPEGVEVMVEERGVAIAGRGLARRWLLDPALRWLSVEVRDG